MITLADSVAPSPTPTPVYFNQSPLNPQGPVGDHIMTVYTPIFWASVVVFVGVSLTIIYAALRFRRQYDDEEPEQVHGNNRLEVAWTLVPFAILATLFVVTFVNMGFINNVPDDQKAGAVNVCVVGQRFNWSYYYNENGCGPAHAGTSPGSVSFAPSDKTAHPSSLTLVVPAGRAIQLHLVSVDVNHSYFIPEISGQVNAIPGQENELWFQVNNPGVYHGACTELCGTGHYTMLVCIDAKSQQDYDTWLADKQAARTSKIPVDSCPLDPGFAGH